MKEKWKGGEAVRERQAQLDAEVLPHIQHFREQGLTWDLVARALDARGLISPGATRGWRGSGLWTANAVRKIALRHGM